MKEYKFKINGNEYNVAINSVSGKIADVTVNGRQYQVELENSSAPAAPVQAAPVQQSAQPAVQPTVPTSAPIPAPKVNGPAKAVTTPLEGIIISVDVKVGDSVKTGQTIAVIEAMKSENEIQSEFEGTVTAINTSKGEHIDAGAPIITLG